MRWLSLFSGIGGFDLALLNKGHEIVGACEIDKNARTIYSRHFPGVKIWEDVTKINPEELPDFDGIVAGFPCQTFSIAGKRLGFKESRGELFFEIARIAEKKRPRYLFLENVKGLLSHDNQKTIITIFNTLAELGYEFEWQVINSLDYVPQNRERIYIIGHLGDKPVKKIFPIINCNQINAETFSKPQGEGKRFRGAYSRTIDANYSKGGGSRTMIAWSKSHRTGKTDADKRRKNYGEIEQRVSFGHANCLNTGEGCRTMSSATFVQEFDHYRILTPLECERLQGFPDNWTSGISDHQRYKCLGNAVTVPVIEDILDHL